MEYVREDAPLVADAQVLMDAACAATGLNDFGPDDSYREGLDVLLRDVAALGDHPQLQAETLGRIVELLATRLRIAEDDRKHPEIRDVAIERPMFILGLPRTGTTITFDMMSQDPGARYPREWEWAMPWPATQAATIDDDPRIGAMQPFLDAIVAGSPELLNVHHFDCRLPGECNGGMMYHFSSSNWWPQVGAWEHAEWLIGARPRGYFETHKRLLQQMHWKGPEGRWLLKSPQHLFDLPGLFDVYPDAQVVWTHRDPVSTFSSLSSMISLLLSSVGLPVDPLKVGDVVQRKWSAAILNAIADRAADPRIDRAVIDQPHKSIISDPLAAMRRNLEFFDQPVTQEFERRLQNFIDNDKNAQRAGRHKHDPANFGIDADKVRRDLAPYYERFGDLIA